MFYLDRGAVRSFTAGEGKGECAHGEYSEYPASTLVPRPDYWAQAEVESTVGYSIPLVSRIPRKGRPAVGSQV